MSFIQRVLEALDARLWKFIRVVHSANHDYPYHDCFYLANDTGSDVAGVYVVGSQNVDAHGDQSKFFTAKRTNIETNTAGTEIRFNDARNVLIVLDDHNYFNGDAVNILCRKEFYANISSVHYVIQDGKYLRVYCEGVLPEEARDAE